MENKILVMVSGGIVTCVMSNRKAEVTVIDYDVEDAPDTYKIPQTDGKTEDAYVYGGDVHEHNPHRLEEITSALEDQFRGDLVKIGKEVWTVYGDGVIQGYNSSTKKVEVNITKPNKKGKMWIATHNGSVFGFFEKHELNFK